MSSAPWRSGLARALHLNRSLVYARYVQLATVTADGQPANRTVVFRGFLEPNQLKFIADSRSRKIPQLTVQPWAEVCWYFPKSREQFRLLGMLKTIQANHLDPALVQARQTQWQDLSDAARLQFAWPDPEQPRADASAFSPAAPDAAQPLPNFCLLLLQPIQVDHLELRGEPQNRTLYRYSAEDQLWSQEAVNP
jgi:PPOX class probable FMN-dependent enzyme